MAFLRRDAPSVCRRVSTPAPRGFTLLEMLVALMIVAIGLSVATLALKPDDRRPLVQEAERLALLLEQAREESELSGTPLAWSWHPGGYAFLRRDLSDNGARWLTVTDDDIFRERLLPHGATIRQVRADGRLLAEGERLSLHGDGVQQVELDLALREARARVMTAPDGRGFAIRVEEAGG
jgi:general secretion pathway protein H